MTPMSALCSTRTRICGMRRLRASAAMKPAVPPPRMRTSRIMRVDLHAARCFLRQDESGDRGDEGGICRLSKISPGGSPRPTKTFRKTARAKHRLARGLRPDFAGHPELLDLNALFLSGTLAVAIAAACGGRRMAVKGRGQASEPKRRSGQRLGTVLFSGERPLQPL